MEFIDDVKQNFKFKIFEFVSGSTKFFNFSGKYLLLNEILLLISWFFGLSGAIFEVSNLYKVSWSILKSTLI